jgi:hypothetical protein
MFSSWNAMANSSRARKDALGERRASPPHDRIQANPASFLTTRKGKAAAPDATEIAVARFLRTFQALLVTTRLYQKDHPLATAAVESANAQLRFALQHLAQVAIRVDGDALAFHRTSSVGPNRLESADRKDPWAGIAEDWTRRGLRSVIFLPQTNARELDAFARWLNATRSPDGVDARTGLAAEHISGIRVNVPIEKSPGTVLATLVAAFVARGGTPAGTDATDSWPAPPTLDDLAAALNLLAQLEPVVRRAPQETPQHTADSLHITLGNAEHRTLSLLVRTMSRQLLREDESVECYLARMAEELLLETLASQFASNRLPIGEVRPLFAALGEAMRHAKSVARAISVGQALSTAPEPAQTSIGVVPLPPALARAARALAPNIAVSPMPDGSLERSEDALSATDSYVQRLHGRFCEEMPARVKAAILRGADAWCMPVSALRHYLEQVLGPERGKQGDAPLRECRIVLLNYARALDAEEPRPRRMVAGALVELMPFVERLWRRDAPSELDRIALRALAAESSPGIAGLLTALVENLARIARQLGNFAEFERILEALEAIPHDAEHAHVAPLISRLTTGDGWRQLVDAALEPRPLDPALPRLLRRDPAHLTERLGALLASPDGIHALPAIARLVRGAGEPVLGALETHLYDARSQRVGTAVKLLAAAEPQRLVDVLPRVLPGWDWNLQDLAVAELSRRGGLVRPQGIARAFAAVVQEAHSMVAPMMLDEIGLANETSAIPLLTRIATGEVETLRDIFIRIKAVEALGRMRALEAADTLRVIVRRHQGLAHTEPAGLRAAAEEALALMENHPSSKRLRAEDEARAEAGHAFPRPRRYRRIALEKPFAARVERSVTFKAHVRNIALGGAFIESSTRFTIGDQIHVNMHAGLRQIRSSGIVRNVTPAGAGIEFLHMSHQDRERLRRLVARLIG